MWLEAQAALPSSPQTSAGPSKTARNRDNKTMRINPPRIIGVFNTGALSVNLNGVLAIYRPNNKHIWMVYG